MKNFTLIDIICTGYYREKEIKQGDEIK